MDHVTAWGHQHASQATRRATAERIVDECFATIRYRFIGAVEKFLAAAPTPAGFASFECLLLTLVRELGRILLQSIVQSLESRQANELPKEVLFEGGGYRRRGDRSRNASVATCFGTIVLWRRGYRSWGRGEETIFPLELLLGLTEGLTPALLDMAGKVFASAGTSQQATLKFLCQQCGVSLGVKRLRKCLDQLYEGLAALREPCQIEKLIELLDLANQSTGSRRPVLSVGRDGITLRDYKHSFFEVATAATISVYDRAGKRLGTVYLAYPPEPNQVTMDQMLTDLLNGVLRAWSGPLPNLAYVTDSGSNEVDYYRRVLRKMKHPVTGKQLDWTRVADFYHVSERVWAMADALFAGNQQHSHAWARRMLRKLKQANGASRVLHSAASLYHRRSLGKSRSENFWKAYRYIQTRTQFLQYHDYKKQHIPLGSGVTEAACKTIYTQRLKLSGMRWSSDGASRILMLRTILLSGTWEATYGRFLEQLNPVSLLTYAKNHSDQLQNVA